MCHPTLIPKWERDLRPKHDPKSKGKGKGKGNYKGKGKEEGKVKAKVKAWAKEKANANPSPSLTVGYTLHGGHEFWLGPRNEYIKGKSQCLADCNMKRANLAKEP